MAKATMSIVKSIADIDDKIKDATAKAGRSQSQAVKLLKRAEVFLGVTITYYVGHILQEFVEKYLDAGIWSFAVYIVVAIIVVGVLWLLRWRERAEE